MSQLQVLSNNIDSSLYPSATEWVMMKEQASMLIKTNFLPSSVRTPEQAIAIMLKGREVGMPPMQAFSHINIIKGKPTISAEGMLALIFRNYPTTKLDYIQNDNEACVIEITKPGNSASRFGFTIADAKQAGIYKDNWLKYPRAMLRSRVVSEMARSLYPEALMGISYTPEEMDSTAEPAAPQPIKVTAEVTPPPMTKAEKMLAAFIEFDETINRAFIEDLLEGTDIEEVDEDQFSQLRDLYADLKAGKVTVKDLAKQLYGNAADNVEAEVVDNGDHEKAKQLDEIF